jgi:hypothetical protein
MGVVSACAFSFMSKYLHQSCVPKPMTRVDINDKNQSSNSKSAKEIWEKLRNIYEGDSKVKAAKLQTYRGQFEQLKMKKDEDITSYFLRVDETVNAIIGLGEEIEESIIVQKVLRSLPMRFNPKISALEERSDLNSISMDELHAIFTAYEMRTEQENPDVKEGAFKASKRSKQKKNEQE